MMPQLLLPWTNATTPSWEMLQVMPGNREVDPEKQLLVTQLLQPWTMSQVMPGIKGLDPEVQLRCPGFSLSWDLPTLNLGHLGV